MCARAALRYRPAAWPSQWSGGLASSGSEGLRSALRQPRRQTATEATAATARHARKFDSACLHVHHFAGAREILVVRHRTCGRAPHISPTSSPRPSPLPLPLHHYASLHVGLPASLNIL
eukprot:6209811-Pleurochrysis_carterae.AAC.1